MDFKLDAFPVDDTVGGIRSTEKIKIIICYILSSVRSEMTRSDIQSTLYDNGMANYFEISHAVDELLNVGAVKAEPQAHGSILVLTDKGRQIAKELEDELSVFIKNKAVRAASLTAVYNKRLKENDITIEKTAEKRYKLTVKLYSGLGESDKLMELSVFLTDQLQAQSMKQSFINNPSKIYEKVIEGLTDDPVFKE